MSSRAAAAIMEEREAGRLNSLVSVVPYLRRQEDGPMIMVGLEEL